MVRHGSILVLLTLTACVVGQEIPLPSKKEKLPTPAPKVLRPPAPIAEPVEPAKLPEPYRIEEDYLPNPVADLKAKLSNLKQVTGGLVDDRQKAAGLAQDLPETEENARLRLRLGKLLTDLSTKPKPAPAKPEPPKVIPPKAIEDPAPVPPPVKKETKDEAPPPPVKVEESPALDRFALAQALFRAGNFQGALQAYKALPTEGLRADERAPVQYMIATCLLKLGKGEEAGAIFRELSNSRGDPQLAECAQWQLASMRWHREMQDTLRDIRRRTAAAEKEP